jgi:hypothetical protein
MKLIDQNNVHFSRNSNLKQRIGGEDPAALFGMATTFVGNPPTRRLMNVIKVKYKRYLNLGSQTCKYISTFKSDIFKC